MSGKGCFSRMVSASKHSPSGQMLRCCPTVARTRLHLKTFYQTAAKTSFADSMATFLSADLLFLSPISLVCIVTVHTFPSLRRIRVHRYGAHVSIVTVHTNESQEKNDNFRENNIATAEKSQRDKETKRQRVSLPQPLPKGKGLVRSPTL